MRGPKLPLALSIAGHAAAMMLLVLGASRIVPPPAPAVTGLVDVVFSRAATPAPPVPAAAPPPPAAAIPEPPPEPEPVKASEPPVIPAPVAETAPVPPPPRKPILRTAVKHVPPRPVRLPAREPSTPTAASPPQYAVAAAMPAAGSPPAVVSGPDPAERYVAMIKAWLERHKRYPDTARQAGEEGSAALRFRVDRAGSVLGYTMLASTGHADLDAGVDEMMRAAHLPPFPPDMPGSQVDISVTIRFNLTR